MLQMVDVHTGSAVLGAVGHHGDPFFRGIGLGALDEMGGCGSGLHAVLKQNVAYLNRGEQMRIANAHVSFPPSRKLFRGHNMMLLYRTECGFAIIHLAFLLQPVCFGEKSARRIGSSGHKE